MMFLVPELGDPLCGGFMRSVLRNKIRAEILPICTAAISTVSGVRHGVRSLFPDFLFK
jgi:hypothetical protein